MGAEMGTRIMQVVAEVVFLHAPRYMLSSVEHRLASLVRQETSHVVSVATQLSRSLASSEERTDVNWYSSVGEVVLDADGR